MEYIRHRNLEVGQPIDEFVHRRAVAKALLIEERKAGPDFFRGLIIGLAISLTLYAALFFAFA